MNIRDSFDWLGFWIAFVVMAIILMGMCCDAKGEELVAGQFIAAVEQVESGGDANAKGDYSKAKGEYLAIGILQIHKIMVDDVNRIVGEKRYTYDDRLDVAKSREMFWIYANHYSNGESLEVIARRWNGGPYGDRLTPKEQKDAKARKRGLQRLKNTAAYWVKVEAAMKASSDAQKERT